MTTVIVPLQLIDVYIFDPNIHTHLFSGRKTIFKLLKRYWFKKLLSLHCSHRLDDKYFILKSMLKQTHLRQYATGFPNNCLARFESTYVTNYKILRSWRTTRIWVKLKKTLLTHLMALFWNDRGSNWLIETMV